MVESDNKIKNNPFKILVLDGGGSKGVYTLGVLYELEQKLGGPIHEFFDLIYGTSTGSIIASLLALGYDVSSIQDIYLKYVPTIMEESSKTGKSNRLKEIADEIFEEKKFNDFKTDIGIVSLNYEDQKPLIFKSNVNQAHGMKSTFKPGFGCSISDAVQASCSAYPVFDIKILETQNQGKIEVVDGGYIANNSTLFALIDARKAFNKNISDIRLLNIGVGTYIEKPINIFFKFFKRFGPIKLFERVISASTNTNYLLATLLYPNLKMLRVSETFNKPEYGTNLVESNEDKLQKMIQLGRSSFGKKETDIENLFK